MDCLISYGTFKLDFQVDNDKIKSALKNSKSFINACQDAGKKPNVRKELLRDLRRLNMAFGDSNIKYYYIGKPSGITHEEREKEKKEWKINVANSSTISQYLGYNSLVRDDQQ